MKKLKFDQIPYCTLKIPEILFFVNIPFFGNFLKQDQNFTFRGHFTPSLQIQIPQKIIKMYPYRVKWSKFGQLFKTLPRRKIEKRQKYTKML